MVCVCGGGVRGSSFSSSIAAGLKFPFGFSRGSDLSADFLQTIRRTDRETASGKTVKTSDT